MDDAKGRTGKLTMFEKSSPIVIFNIMGVGRFYGMERPNATYLLDSYANRRFYLR